MKTTDLVFWYMNGDKPRAIDVIVEDDDGTQRGLYCGKTGEELAEQYGAEVKVATTQDYSAAFEAAYRTEPAPVSIERFESMRDVLPPQDWRRSRGMETFKMQEHTAGRMTLILARHGERCWAFTDLYSLTHDEIVEKIIKAEAAA